MKTSKIEKAVECYPESVKAQDNLGGLLLKFNQVDKAIEHYEKAVEVNPKAAIMHYKLGVLFLQQGSLDEAVGSFTEAMRAKPGWVQPMNNTAWLMATHKDAAFYNPQEAIRLAQKVCELTKYKRADFLDTLSVAYAAAGRFGEAIATAEKALELVQSPEQFKLAEEIRKHLSLYKAGEPYVEP